ncbi:MAG: DUF1624 domain-containing protein [Oscillospiraceae bacterium]|nr:DUF1624 domain-containing protein [Oscillospiraceae bacterium]
MKKRIWELDVFRGICILGVIAMHFVYDMVELYGLVDWDYPAAFTFVRDWGGVLFLLLSGTCVTLGSRSVRRGLIVLGCGLGITAVTLGMYWLKLYDRSIIIYFGVLHCLGICMLLWPLFRNFPWWALLICGGVLTAFGFWLWAQPPVEHCWLMVFGLPWRGFASADYFPLLPHFGFFLLGAVLGKTLYRRKESLMPGVDTRNILIRFFSFCGKQSLWLYLLHQPLLTGIFYLILMLK